MLSWKRLTARFAMFVVFPALLALFQNCSSPSSNSAADSSNPSGDPAPVTRPLGPSHLDVTNVSSTEQSLVWQDNSDNEAGFRIEYATSSTGPFTLLANVGSGVTTYLSTDLAPATWHHYRVYAFNSVGDSDIYSQDYARTNATPVYPPNSPSAPTATALSATQVELTWVDNSNDEHGFQIHRSTSASGPFVNVAAKLANVTTGIDQSGLEGGTTYYYRIVAYGPGGLSAPTDVVSATTLPPPPPSPAPVVATVVSSTRIDLTWVDGSSAEQGFIVEIGPSIFGPYTEIGNLPPNTTSLSATGLSPNTAYFFRIKVYNEHGANYGMATATTAPY